MGKWTWALVLVVLLGAAAWFIWPTPYARGWEVAGAVHDEMGLNPMVKEARDGWALIHAETRTWRFGGRNAIARGARSSRSTRVSRRGSSGIRSATARRPDSARSAASTSRRRRRSGS